MVMALLYTIPQVHTIVTGQTEGLNLAIFTIFMAYITLSLSLSISAYKLHPNKERKQTIIIFVQWLVYIGLILILGLRHIIWSRGDTIVSISVLLLSAVTVIYYKGFNDPYGKGLLNVWCKGMPQLWLAYTIYEAGGGSGLPFITLIAGHLTSIPRLATVTLNGFRDGWDKPTIGLVLGESANVATWTVVTIVWALFKLSV